MDALVILSGVTNTPPKCDDLMATKAGHSHSMVRSFLILIIHSISLHPYIGEVSVQCAVAS